MGQIWFQGWLTLNQSRSKAESILHSRRNRPFFNGIKQSSPFTKFESHVIEISKSDKTKVPCKIISIVNKFLKDWWLKLEGSAELSDRHIRADFEAWLDEHWLVWGSSRLSGRSTSRSTTTEKIKHTIRKCDIEKQEQQAQVLQFVRFVRLSVAEGLVSAWQFRDQIGGCKGTLQPTSVSPSANFR